VAPYALVLFTIFDAAVIVPGKFQGEFTRVPENFKALVFVSGNDIDRVAGIQTLILPEMLIVKVPPDGPGLNHRRHKRRGREYQ